jgi:hypothetical protein
MEVKQIKVIYSVNEEFHHEHWFTLRYDQNLERGVREDFYERMGFRDIRFYDEHKNHLPYNTLIKNVPSEIVIITKRSEWKFPKFA